MAVDDPFDTSDMQTARHHLKRLLSDWRDAGGDVDVLTRFFEGFVACKVSEMMQQREAYLAQETGRDADDDRGGAGWSLQCLAPKPRSGG